MRAVNVSDILATGLEIDRRETIYEEVEPSILLVDPTYQRPLSEQRVKQMASRFDRDAFGVIEVNLRATGELYTIDGQHRTQVWQLVMPGKPIPCLIHDRLTVQQEAALFGIMNNSRNQPSQVDRFRALLRAREPRAVAIYALLQGHGLDIGWNMKGSQKQTVVAVAALQSIYGTTGGVLAAVLQVIVGAWGGDAASLTSHFLYGMERFVRRYQDEYSEPRLIDRLRRVTALEVQHQARLKKLVTSDVRLAYALTFAEVYNHGLRNHMKLTEWQQTENHRYTGPGTREQFLKQRHGEE